MSSKLAHRTVRTVGAQIASGRLMTDLTRRSFLGLVPAAAAVIVLSAPVIITADPIHLGLAHFTPHSFQAEYPGEIKMRRRIMIAVMNRTLKKYNIISWVQKPIIIESEDLLMASTKLEIHARFYGNRLPVVHD